MRPVRSVFLGWKSRLVRRSLVAVLVLVVAQPVLAATTVVVGTDPSRTVIKGMLVTPDQVIDGELIIEGDTITCVAVICEAPTGATRIAVTSAYIFPGFVDAHNHVAYNILPRWTPPKLYKNRGQWQGSDPYKAFKKPYDDLKGKGLDCEMIKYGEVKALLSGVTTSRGPPRARSASGRSFETPRTRATWGRPPATSGRSFWTSGASRAPSTGRRPRASSSISPKASGAIRNR
jgi:hypothetical protein